MSEIIVEDYNLLWPELFQRLRNRIWPVISGVAVSIEHVGSTAVPGLAAKPVIDMSIIVETESKMRHLITLLAENGMHHRGDLGIPGREAFTRLEDLPPHNLYACLSGNLGLKNHLTIRDYLRKHPQAIAEYSALKKRLAAQFKNDIDAYVEGKSEFLAQILKNSGFTKVELDQIFQVNKKDSPPSLDARS